jgi:hypothetical protein
MNILFFLRTRVHEYTCPRRRVIPRRDAEIQNKVRHQVRQIQRTVAITSKGWNEGRIG